MLFRSDRKSTRLNSSHTIISYALPIRSEEHTSELQSHDNLVCRLLLEKKKQEHARQGGGRSPDASEAVADQTVLLVFTLALCLISRLFLQASPPFYFLSFFSFPRSPPSFSRRPPVFLPFLAS